MIGQIIAKAVAATSSSSGRLGTLIRTNLAKQNLPDMPRQVRVLMTWRTQRDERVCKRCAALDGASVVYGEGDPGAEVFNSPLHPRCRCTRFHETNYDLR